MHKIFKSFCFLFYVLAISSQTAIAKLNLFENPRYIPNLSYYSDSGKKYKLTDNEEDLLIALVWSRTCGPCISEMKHLQSFADETKDKGIKVIVISPAEEWRTSDERINFMKKIGAPRLTSYTDPKSNFAHGMGIMVTPTAIMVSRNGEEIGQITGAVNWDDPDVIDYLIRLKEDLYKKKSK